MLTLNAARFMNLMMHLRTIQYVAYGADDVPIDAESKKSIAQYTTGMRALCQELHLPTSDDLATYLDTSRNWGMFRSSLAALEKAIHAELKQRLFFEPDARFKPHFKNDQLFGPEVFKAFPSANDDIYEAGMCLALERGTACVMHLMRVVESGLKVLAKALGVGAQNDWGSYLREIDKELVKRYKTSGARTPDEMFYAEVAADIDRVRRAWRNPTMHVENSYSPDRAEEILGAVKSLMTHLATRLSE